MLNQDAKEILSAAISIGEALADGIQLSDVGALMDLPAAISGWNVGIENLKETAINAPAEINDYVVAEFDIPDDELEAKIEKSLSWATATYELYLLWKPKDEVEE